MFRGRLESYYRFCKLWTIPSPCQVYLDCRIRFGLYLELKTYHLSRSPGSFPDPTGLSVSPLSS